MPRLVVLTVAALLLLAPTARASFVVSPAHVRSPVAGVGPSGDTVAAWERVFPKRVVIESRVGRDAHALGRVQRFTTGTGPRVAVGADGTAALIWVERGGTLRAALARPGHPFGPARVLDHSTHRTVGVAIQPGGRVVVASTDRTDHLRVATTTRGGSFGASHTLARVGFGPPSLVLDPRDGAAVIAYSTRPGSRTSSQAAVATLAPDATVFTAPVELTDAPTVSSEPTAISGPGGVAVAINGSGLYLARRGADGRWSPPVAFASQPDNSGKQFPEFLSAPSAALLADGSAIPVWWLEVNAPDASDELLRGEVYAADQLLTPAQGIASPPSVAVAGGDAFIASAVDRGPVDLFTRAAGATTFTPSILSPNGQGDAQLTAAGPHVLAAFRRNDHLRLTVVR